MDFLFLIIGLFLRKKTNLKKGIQYFKTKTSKHLFLNTYFLLHSYLNIQFVNSSLTLQNETVNSSEEILFKLYNYLGRLV